MMIFLLFLWLDFFLGQHHGPDDGDQEQDGCDFKREQELGA